MKHLANRKDIIRYIAISVIFSIFIGLSLSCGASDPAPAPEPKSTITLEDLNTQIKNQEVNLLANNGLTAEQLMEVIKLCIQTGEITDVALIEENTKLSYGVLAVNMNLSNIPVTVKFSCSISKSGTLKMRVTSVTEQNPSVAAFEVTVLTKEYDAKCTALKNTILNKIESIGNTVLERSADFA